eukprot:470498_1
MFCVPGSVCSSSIRFFSTINFYLIHEASEASETLYYTREVYVFPKISQITRRKKFPTLVVSNLEGKSLNCFLMKMSKNIVCSKLQTKKLKTRGITTYQT